METKDDSQSQAIAQFESIKNLLVTYDASEDLPDYEIETARENIQDNALSVQVRGPWYSPGEPFQKTGPVEYEILLCTGGPAVRIVGELDEHGQPDSAVLEHQDWGTPWTEAKGLTFFDSATLLRYAQFFYFGEGA